MKGYYIFFGAEVPMNIRKKMDMQMRVLEQISEIEEIDILSLSRTTLQKVLDRLPFVNIGKWDIAGALERIKNPDYLYVRRTFADKQYIDFFREIKKRYPACKIIVEIFTYPYYRDDFMSIRDFPFLFKELLVRKYFKEVVDRFATYSLNSEIFGVKAIHMINGIDISQFQPAAVNTESTTINMLALACFASHHGYERIISGLDVYYKDGGTRDIELLMVGDGPERKKYEMLSKNYGLEKHVRFLGMKSGEELDRILDNTDIALGSFGLYKKKLEVSSVLKVREYLARGLPVMSGCTEDVFMGNEVDFYLHFPNDSSSIDVNRVLEFVDKLYGKDKSKKQETIQRIRQFAEENVSIWRTFQPVLDFIEEEG